MRLEKIQIIFITVICGMFMAAFFHFLLMPIIGFDSYPFNTFLYNQADRFFDFTQNTLVAFQSNRSPYTNSDLFYFPGIAILMLPFIELDVSTSLFVYQTFWVFAFVVVIQPYLSGFRLSQRISIIFIFLFCYPLLFTFDRAQIEGLLLVFLIWSIWEKEHRHNSFPFYVVVALASSVKIYPLLYLLPDFVKQKYKNILMTGILTIVFMAFGMLFMKGDLAVNIQNLVNNLKFYQNEYMTGYEGTHHSVSIIASVRFILLILSESIQINLEFLIRWWGRFWPIVSIAGVLYAARLLAKTRDESLWKSYFIVACSFCLLAPVSFDYKLIHFFIPILFFLKADDKNRNDALYSVLFGLLLIPKSFIILKEETSIAVFLNLLLILFFVSRIAMQSKNSEAGFRYDS